MDRYGLSHVLARYCGLHAPRRSFANWVHGWIWDEELTAEVLSCARLPREVSIVVRDERERDALNREGFLNVVVGGLPFAYVQPQHSSRHADALLAIPPHSAEVERLTRGQGEYMDYLESLKGAFDGVYVSIFHLDWDGPMHRAAVDRGLHIVQGARPDDANSLVRVRALFEAFDFVTTNTIGSHFVYALYAGSRFSFCGPLFIYDEEILLGNGNAHGHSRGYIDRLIEIQSEDYLRRRYGRFFAAEPRSGVVDRVFGSDEVGTAAMLPPSDVMDALGWTPWGQAIGYAKGALRRLRRL